MNEDTNRIDPPDDDPDWEVCPLCHGEGGDIETGRGCPVCLGTGMQEWFGS